MKKLLIILLSLIPFVLQAQTIERYRATAVSINYKNSYGNWVGYSAWESVNIPIDFSESTIVIYSNVTQIYVITSIGNIYTDNKGGKVVPIKVIDQDLDCGTIRLRRPAVGNLQIYIDFSDISWVYNLNR